MRTALALGIALAVADTAAAEPTSFVGSRVRSSSPPIVAAIATATAQSPTFRALIDAIDATDGIVYLEEGRCGHGVRACLAAVTQAGANRVVRIHVGKYSSALSLMTAIGHELRHAIEVLGNRDIKSTEAMQQFYLRQGSRGSGGAMETSAASAAGNSVRAELRDYQKAEAAR